MFGLQRGQPRFEIHVLFGDILRLAGRTQHMAFLPDLGKKRVIAGLRHAHRIVCVAVSNIAGNRGCFQIAAKAGGQLTQESVRVVEILALQIHVAGKDDLGVSQRWRNGGGGLAFCHIGG